MHWHFEDVSNSDVGSTVVQPHRAASKTVDCMKIMTFFTENLLLAEWKYPWVSNLFSAKLAKWNKMYGSVLIITTGIKEKKNSSTLGLNKQDEQSILYCWIGFFRSWYRMACTCLGNNVIKLGRWKNLLRVLASSVQHSPVYLAIHLWIQQLFFWGRCYYLDHYQSSYILLWCINTQTDVKCSADAEGRYCWCSSSRIIEENKLHAHTHITQKYTHI